MKDWLRRLWMNLQHIFYFIFGRNHKCQCGHKAKWKTKLTVNGECGVYTLKKSKENCPTCWANAAIKCAWCGGNICCGEPITLYTPKENSEIPSHAVVYKQTPHIQLVGCLRWDCAEGGIDRTGFWVMPGKVKRVASPMEILLGGEHDNILIVNDLHDQNEAIPIPDEIVKPDE